MFEYEVERIILFHDIAKKFNVIIKIDYLTLNILLKLTKAKEQKTYEDIEIFELMIYNIKSS